MEWFYTGLRHFEIRWQDESYTRFGLGVRKETVFLSNSNEIGEDARA